MKNLTTTLTLILLLVLCCGCGGDKDPIKVEPEVVLETSLTSLSFKAKGETKTFSVKAVGEWVVSTSEKWVTTSKAMGSGEGTIDVTTEVNDQIKTRTAKVWVKQGKYMVEIQVSQLGTEADMLVDETTRVINYPAGELEIDITTNVEYDVIIDGSWITEKKSKAMVKSIHTFVYEKNVALPRSAKITFKQKDGTLSRTVIVDQSSHGVMFYDQESFKKQAALGTYISAVFTFAFDQDIHQRSINPIRKSQRIQTFNQDTISAVTLSVIPATEAQEVEVTYDNRYNEKSEKGSFKTKVVKIENDKAWLWSESDKAGFVVNNGK